MANLLSQAGRFAPSRQWVVVSSPQAVLTSCGDTWRGKKVTTFQPCCEGRALSPAVPPLPGWPHSWVAFVKGPLWAGVDGAEPQLPPCASKEGCPWLRAPPVVTAKPGFPQESLGPT